MGKNFISSKFNPPTCIQRDDFIMKKLTVKEVEKDYEAVMSSRVSLRKIFSDHDEWPRDDMTIADNYKDLQVHEDEFDNREAFTYTLVDLEDTKCLGCVYIYPWRYGTYDSQVYYWVTDEMKVQGLEDKVFTFLDSWLKETWQFKDVVYPGRSVSFKALQSRIEAVKEMA